MTPLADSLLLWLDRLSADIEISADDRSLWGPDFRDEVHRAGQQIRRETSAGSRVVLPALGGLDHWIRLTAAWIEDRSVVPLAARASDSLKKAVTGAASRPAGEAAVWFTSGSTGLPKGARLTAEGILANGSASGDVLRLPAGARLLVPLPFSSISSLSHFLVALRAGASFIGREQSLFPGAFLREADRVGADAVGGAPLHLRWALGAQRPWRWLMASGDRLDGESVKELRRKFPAARLNVVYGMTELSGRAFVLGGEEVEGREHTVGRGLRGLESRLDPESGELQYRGPFVMGGYEGRGEEGFTEDGWLASGDVGRFDGEGGLSLHGRVDDVFKCAGNKVSAGSIVDALWKLHEFVDLAVVGVAHPLLGQVPHAFVVPKSGQWDSAGTLKRLRAVLPADHVPRGFTVLTSLPRTESGKLRRGELLRRDCL